MGAREGPVDPEKGEAGRRKAELISPCRPKIPLGVREARKGSKNNPALYSQENKLE